MEVAGPCMEIASLSNSCCCVWCQACALSCRNCRCSGGLNKSRYRGVSYDRKKAKWRVQIKVGAFLFGGCHKRAAVGYRMLAPGWHLMLCAEFNGSRDGGPCLRHAPCLCKPTRAHFNHDPHQ